MKSLTREEFIATFAEPMKELSSESPAPFTFWNYFDAIPLADFLGYDCATCEVANVNENAHGTYQHVLVKSNIKNAFMVLVLDIKAREVLGHRLLDLNEEYGLTPET